MEKITATGAFRKYGHRQRVRSRGAKVGIGKNDSGGFSLAVDLVVALPKLDREAAQKLVEAAHQVCPYSNATRNNIAVNLSAHGGK